MVPFGDKMVHSPNLVFSKHCELRLRAIPGVLGIWSESFLTPSLSSKGFPCGSAGKESTCNAGDLGLTPGLGRSLGEGNSYPLQYSGLEKSMDCTVHGVAKSPTRLSDFHSLSSRQQNYTWNFPGCPVVKTLSS